MDTLDGNALEPFSAILLVEDDYAISRMVWRALKGHGYKVIMTDEQSLNCGLLLYVRPSIMVIDISIRAAANGAGRADIAQKSEAPILYISSQPVNPGWMPTLIMDTPLWPTHLRAKIRHLLASGPEEMSRVAYG